MRPTSTLYRLARPGGEYNRLYALMEREGFPRHSLRVPTVVAERNGKVVGFLGTWDVANAVVAGPAVIEGGRNMLMMLRLMEAYENVLRFSRIPSYMFTVDRGNFTHIARVKSLGIAQIGEDANHVWFKRELQ